MHQSIPAVLIPPGPYSGAFFLIVHPGGHALVYPGAFDGFVIFTSQHCHSLSVISSSGKDNNFVINFVLKGQNDMSDQQYD